LATTNRIDVLDPAILRPGRFDRIIEIPLPNLRGRYEIFKIHTRKMPLSNDVDLIELSKLTEGATGADIKTICIEAALKAIRIGRELVYKEDFVEAIKKVMRNRYRPYAFYNMNNRDSTEANRYHL